MTTTTLTVLLSVALALGTDSAHALSRCKVRIHHADGTILVSAKGVSGTLRWGNEAGLEVNAFSDPCVANGKANNCTLGAAGTLERITPPPGCTLYLADDEGVCSAYVKGCTPGDRVVDQAQIDANTAAIAHNTEVIGSVLRCEPVPGGVCVGNVPWYYGASGQSCQTVCAHVGRPYDEATRTYAGSDGTNEHCAEVLQALQAAGWPVPDPDFGGIVEGDASHGNLGCFVLRAVSIDSTLTYWSRAVGGAGTDAASAASFVERACACRYPWPP